MTPQEQPMCANLRCKGMYVVKGGAPAAVFGGDTTSWWCLKTAYAVGPDGDWVHKTACDPSRPCYEEGRRAPT